MAYNGGQPHGPGPFPQYPQSTPAYSQAAPPYPQPTPPYPQPTPPYPQPAPQLPQPAPQYPQPAPQYPQAAPQYAQAPAQPPPAYPQQQSSDPSAPPQIDGYRDIGFAGGLVRPPAQTLPSGPPPEQPALTLTQRPLTRDEVTDALTAFVGRHCCYGSGPIKEIQIRNVAPTFTLKYTLDTFVEKRETKWKFEPSAGGGPGNAGIPPGPWDVPLTPKALFKNEKRVLEVPHTQCLRPCHECQAHGDVRCKRCSGRGQERCGQCSGSGQRLGEACAFCGGVGTKQCTPCTGGGMVTCPACKGRRNLKYYVELTVTWELHTERYVVDTPGVPNSEIAAVSGETVCQAQGLHVWPFVGFPDSRVGTASERLVKKHQTDWPMARLLQQRHDVQQVPIFSVDYSYRGRDGTFFICGREKNVHFPDYPSQCCGCCCLVM